jgi:DNA-binding SARP family transcriptional activator
MLRVQLFGPGKAEYDGKLLDEFPHQQAYILLCYLLINKAFPHHRERLASVFWGDYPTVTARKYLRNSLWRLRVSLGSLGAPAEQYIVSTEEFISFGAGCPYWLDVDVFESITSRLIDIPPEDIRPEQVSELEEAASLYTGNLLESIYDDWCLYERERLRLIYFNLLIDLMRIHGHNHAFDRGLKYGERILAQDNTREDVHRTMMWLYWQLGERNAALTQYKLCCQILREEFGVPPMDSTRQLHEQMLQNRVEVAPHFARQAPANPGNMEAETSRSSPAENALRKLHHLQKITEETNLELRQIEQLLHKLLAESQL